MTFEKNKKQKNKKKNKKKKKKKNKKKQKQKKKQKTKKNRPIHIIDRLKCWPIHILHALWFFIPIHIESTLRCLHTCLQIKKYNCISQNKGHLLVSIILYTGTHLH